MATAAASERRSIASRRLVRPARLTGVAAWLRAVGERGDGLAQGRLLRRPEDPGGVAGVGEAIGEGGEVGGRPLLRRTVFGAGAERDDRAPAAEAEFRGNAAGLIGVVREHRRHGHRQGFARPGGERDEAIDRPPEPLRIETARVVEQSIAPLAEIASPPWDPRGERHDGRFERPGKDDGECVALAAQSPAGGEALEEIEAAVRGVDQDRVADSRHAAAEGCGIGRRQEVDGVVGGAPLQGCDEALCHHHVADPGRGDDEHARHQAAAWALASRVSRTPSSIATKSSR